MPSHSSLADLGKSREAALERLLKVQKEREIATPAEIPKIESYIDAVERDIRRFDGAIRDYRPSH
jgi:hypothetical protein